MQNMCSRSQEQGSGGIPFRPLSVSKSTPVVNTSFQQSITQVFCMIDLIQKFFETIFEKLLDIHFFLTNLFLTGSSLHSKTKTQLAIKISFLSVITIDLYYQANKTIFISIYIKPISEITHIQRLIYPYSLRTVLHSRKYSKKAVKGKNQIV